MSPATPTTTAISNNIVAQLEASLSQTIPLLPKAFARVLAWVLAGAIVITYKYAGFIFLQLFVAHASAEETIVNGKKIRPLVEWGRVFGVGDPNASQRAELIVSVPVTNQTGTLAAGAVLLRTPTRILYKVVAAVALNAPTVQARVRAFSDESGGDGSGAIGNLNAGDELSFANQPANVGSTATVVSQEVTGADAEDVEVYRQRVMRRAKRRPQGGAHADYQAWGEEVEGILNVYPYAGERPDSGPGWVDVYVEATVATSDADGIPTAPQLAAVLASINLDVSGKATRRPVGAKPNVQPITRVGFAFEIEGLAPDTPDIRSAVEEGLDEYLRSREPYIEGLSTLPREDRITEVATGGIVETIVSANGATITTLSMTPGPAYTLGHGEKAKSSGVTWV